MVLLYIRCLGSASMFTKLPLPTYGAQALDGAEVGVAGDDWTPMMP
jgi:hypothetical protein